MRSTTMTGTLALLLAAAVTGAPLRGGMIGMAGGAAPELTRVSAAFAAAMRAGDAKAAAALFAEDGTDMPPGSGPVRGHAAIEAYYRGLFATCHFAKFELTETESRIAGDVGFLTGTARIALAGAPEESGKYLVVLKRSGDAWKVAYAMHNEDRPSAGPPPAPSR
jgi:uncharacterized protein (TIGR02246 family)